MCCFLVPGAEAVILFAAAGALKRWGRGTAAASAVRHFSRLTGLLFGGSLLLALEHLWHGEIMLAPPFITAMKTPEDTAVMLEEISTTGVLMAVTVTCAYVLYELASGLARSWNRRAVAELS